MSTAIADDRRRQTAPRRVEELRGLRVYVASSFFRYLEAREVMDALTAAGHQITHDWTRTDAFDEDGEPRIALAPIPGTSSYGLGQAGYDLPEHEQVRHAREDLNGVRRADVLLALGEKASLGWPIELGYAIARRATVFLVAPWVPTVFLALPSVHVFDRLGDALALLGAQDPTS